ncbi:hypothetical protein MYSTI_03289 [Myxococcus stipitatus DSM 14675]|uniref:Uncharacterized protein n=1 Tax=Myxococcus stipitatus (strain DSM 14675 / JCM 12634 / Mx s8) TaxID=1278073 RepID=L7U6U7_MYXSD|nr:hypothetical protein MYSTI_03289 [Myxococcus stipitatus DSM 14675]
MIGQTRRVAWAVTAWLVVVSGLHLWLNLDWSSLRNEWKTEETRKLNVAYIPVT